MVRRIQAVALALALAVAAFATGLELLFYVLYLGLLVVGGAYLVTRTGLLDLEAGYALDRLHAHVGEQLRATYTLRNVGRWPKLWLEIHNPSTLPVPLPGRALSLGPYEERSWVAKVPLVRRGHFRVDALGIRTGDPFGFFEAAASVGRGASIVVYPRIEQLTGWRLPKATLEGTRGNRERTHQTTPLVTSVRQYLPGDAYNRIHWKSSARHQELQVKEFEVEQAADAWIFVDLQSGVQAGRGDESTVEVAVRIAASIAFKALAENRAVGMTVSGHRLTILPADRGPRQYRKIMELLAAAEGDGSIPFGEILLRTTARVRRGMAAIAITSSSDTSWIRPLTALRQRGVGCRVIWLDAPAFAAEQQGTPTEEKGAPTEEPVRGDRAATEIGTARRPARAIAHALAEFDLPSVTIGPRANLTAALTVRQPRAGQLPAAVLGR
jgi:uncharacterized protein (DUF58 family)